jgi:hypothetical protein
LSREDGDQGATKALSRSAAEKIIKSHLLAIAEGDHQGLSTQRVRYSG